ncbi:MULTISPECIES: YgaP-like transmembrane domain [unclassified Sedimentibacter]|uniref:YgaP-like transmembrane domain n=1 Tax=unclassified Sedimentibacter TaxID=2649220 RepID=UPI0027DFAFFF|nr:YgaP-like transmembrane domain [Sedimentibacter sp. MB35-C1]WMJ76771.1 DUF2892 domain-containing protein [Sedimentibacter sp. MB35-C1]
MKKIFPPTTKRIALNTNSATNANIKNNTLRRINIYKNSSDKILSDNIDKLNSEWDIDRIIEVRAASIVLASTIIGLTTNKKYWFMLSGTAGLFLMQHALQGWCPSVPIIRKLGIRTSEEINNEKIVYKMLRDDFSVKSANVEELHSVAEK